MADKIRNLWFKLKAYWRKPPRGYDVTYKEFVNLSLGYGGLSFLSTIVNYTTITASVVIMVKYFRLSTGLILFMSLLGSIITLLRSPILSMIIDNANDKRGRGKFKPFLLWTTIVSAVLLGSVVFLPTSWNDIVLFTLRIPAIPILGVLEPSVNDVGLATLLMFVMVQCGLFTQTLFSQALAGIEQTISTVAQERANIGALRGLICNIPSSLINIVIASILVPAFTKSTTVDGVTTILKDGWADISVYRIMFPICAVGSVLLVLFTVFGTQERVVVHKKYVARVKFFEGAKILVRSKAFWIIAILNFAVGIRAYATFTSWIQQYSFATASARRLAGLFCTTLLMNILVLGMVLGPLLIKKFGKKRVLCVANIGAAVFIALQLLVYRHPVVILATAFMQNLFTGFAYISGIMVSDILDELQYKTGKRLEGFWLNFIAIVTTILGFLTLLAAPLFLSFGGIGFSDSLDTALRDVDKRNGAYFYYTLLGLIGAVIACVPVLFYDLDEKKHAKIVKVLRIRAACDNYETNEITDADILNVHDISLQAAESGDEMLLAELSLHPEIDSILELFDEANARHEAAERREGIADLMRELELEIKRVEARLSALSARADKRGTAFDSTATRLELLSHTEYLRYFTAGELVGYTDYDMMLRDSEHVYDLVCAAKK